LRAALLREVGGPFEIADLPDPVADGTVVVAVRAAGVNFADVMARIGLYPDAPKPPCVIGYEVAGTVLELGEGVDGPAVGTRVFAPTRFGGYQEQVVVPAGDVTELPDQFTFEQGAAIPVNYATAYAGLVRYGNLQRGERVLIQAAAGGVGIAATQIAKYHGAEVYGTASPSKHEAIRGFGVDHPLDYTKDGWEKGLPEFDVIMDAIGGKSFRRSYDMLRAGGRLVAFGASSVMQGEKRNLARAAPEALPMPKFNLIKQMSASKAVIGLNALTLWDSFGSITPWIEPLNDMLLSGAATPVVSHEIPLENAGEAHRVIVERRNVGKVVLVR